MNMHTIDIYPKDLSDIISIHHACLTQYSGHKILFAFQIFISNLCQADTVETHCYVGSILIIAQQSVHFDLVGLHQLHGITTEQIREAQPRGRGWVKRLITKGVWLKK